MKIRINVRTHVCVIKTCMNTYVHFVLYSTLQVRALRSVIFRIDRTFILFVQIEKIHESYDPEICPVFIDQIKRYFGIIIIKLFLKSTYTILLQHVIGANISEILYSFCTAQTVK